MPQPAPNPILASLVAFAVTFGGGKRATSPGIEGGREVHGWGRGLPASFGV